jgi:hypothetical protein
MKSIEEIITACSNLAPGTMIKISGLKSSKQADSSPDSDPVTYELLEAGGYADMQRRSLVMLEKAVFLDAATSTAASQIVMSLHKSLDPEKPLSTTTGGYERIEGSTSLFTSPSAPDAVYMLRLRRLGSIPEPTPAKGEIPRLKQSITRSLSLPIGSYVHAVKFVDGMFDSLEIC